MLDNENTRRSGSIYADAKQRREDRKIRSGAAYTTQGGGDLLLSGPAYSSPKSLTSKDNWDAMFKPQMQRSTGLSGMPAGVTPQTAENDIPGLASPWAGAATQTAKGFSFGSGMSGDMAQPAMQAQAPDHAVSWMPKPAPMAGGWQNPGQQGARDVLRQFKKPGSAASFQWGSNSRAA